MHHHDKEKHKNKSVRKQPLALAHFILEGMFQGSKKFFQFSLKPKNPNLDNNTQRWDQKI